MTHRRIALLLILASVLAGGTIAWLMSCHRIRTLNALIIWHPPSGEAVDMQVGALSSDAIATLSLRKHVDGSKHLVIREVTIGGRVHREFDLGQRGDFVYLGGVAPKWYRIAVTSYQGRRSRSFILDTRQGSILNLNVGDIFLFPSEGNAAAFSDNGRRALIGRIGTRSLRIIDADTGRLVRAINPAPTLNPELIRWMSSGEHLVWWDSHAKILGSEPSTRRGHQSKAIRLKRTECVSLSLDATKLAVSRVGTGILDVAIYNVSNGRLDFRVKRKLPAHQSVSCLKWSPNGNRIAISINDEEDIAGTSIYVLDTSHTLQYVDAQGWRFAGYENGMAWSPDSKWLAAVVFPEAMDDSKSSVGLSLAVIAIR